MGNGRKTKAGWTKFCRQGSTSAKMLPGKIRLFRAAITITLLAASTGALAAENELTGSVYCTAGGVQKYLTNDEGRERALRAIKPLHASRLFLEGRRGDEYVPPAELKEIRRFFESNHIHCSGGIATVAGRTL